MKKNNTIQTLCLLVKELGIAVTCQSISDELQKHPNYNSILAYSDVLNNWRIPNEAYSLSFDELADVPVPFIAHLSNNEFVLVNQLNEKEVRVSNGTWKHKKFTSAEFKNLYGGSILVAEKGEAFGEVDYKTKRLHEIINEWRMPVFLIGAFILFFGFLFLHSAYLSALSFQIVVLTLIKTLGLVTAILLLIQSIDANNPFIQKLCSGDKKDCNAILSSKAAKVNEFLTWSEVGFFYFAGTWLVLLFNSNDVPVLYALALLNIISLPYTFYSVYYQGWVAKQWCVLCCAIQGLLWLEFFAFLPNLLNSMQVPNFREWMNLVMGIAIPVLLWMIIKPYLLKAKQINPLKQQLRKLKYNTELFENSINNEVKLDLPDDRHSLVIGNPAAEQIITMVSNPYCQPCAKAHKTLEEWLVNRDDIKLQVIFSIFNTEDKTSEIAGHLMALQANQDALSLKKALTDWYEQKHKNYESWAKEYPKPANLSLNEALEKQKEWCIMADITATPTLFINGRRLPKNYQPEDLRYFI